MTQRAFESCDRAMERYARSERRLIARAQLGVCAACLTPLAQHFDEANHFIRCEDVAHLTASQGAPETMEHAAPRRAEPTNETTEFGCGVSH